jgi:hypothetical protein
MKIKKFPSKGVQHYTRDKYYKGNEINDTHFQLVDYILLIRNNSKMNDDGSMGFELQDGIFKKFVERARENYEKSQKSNSQQPNSHSTQIEDSDKKKVNLEELSLEELEKMQEKLFVDIQKARLREDKEAEKEMYSEWRKVRSAVWIKEREKKAKEETVAKAKAEEVAAKEKAEEVAAKEKAEEEAAAKEKAAAISSLLDKIRLEGEEEERYADLSQVDDNRYEQLIKDTDSDYVLFLNQHYLKWQEKPLRTLFHITSYSLFDKNQKEVTRGNNYFTSMNLESKDKLSKDSRKSSSKIVSTIVKSLSK